MLSKPLIFLFGILILLFFVISCFSGAAIAQVEDQKLVKLPAPDPTLILEANSFIVYGRADTNEGPLIQVGDNSEPLITGDVTYVPVPDLSSVPPLSLEKFFEFGGTLELVTTDDTLSKDNIVISEIMWGIDDGFLRSQPEVTDNTYIQWIELYNNTDKNITVNEPYLYLLFTPFRNHPDRDIITPSDVENNVELPDGQSVYVLDAVSNLHLGKWNLPGKSGRLPFSSIISAYRDIPYPEDNGVRRVEVPFGSYADSWKETPEQGSRNTKPSIPNGRGRMIATPGAPHVSDTFLDPSLTTEVFSDQVVINEVRNDTSRHNLDWIELKNVGYLEVDLKEWELSIVSRVDGKNRDQPIVVLPQYILFPDEILLIQRQHPSETQLADGIDISEPVGRPRGAIHQYLVEPDLMLPNNGRFTLLLRSESDKSGQDVAIEDYAGNGFFSNPPDFTTDFWPRVGQRRPKNVALFGNPSFGSPNMAWARLRYQEDDGHHKDAWREVGTQGGIGYDPGADLSVSPGTSGYENDALKMRVDDNNFRTPSIGNEYDEGELSISECCLVSQNQLSQDGLSFCI